MQVFGLPGYVIRNGRAASRLVGRAGRRKGRRRGQRCPLHALPLGEGRGAESRKPHRSRRPQWPRELARAVEAACADNPMWGKCKIEVLCARRVLGQRLHRRAHPGRARQARRRNLPPTGPPRGAFASPLSSATAGRPPTGRKVSRSNSSISTRCSTSSSPTSTPSPKVSKAQRQPWRTEPPSIFTPSVEKTPNRLIYPEPGHTLDIAMVPAI